MTRLPLGATLAVAAILGACNRPAPVAPAHLVLTGGRVVTVDGTHPEAQALAIRGEHIVAVGSVEEIARHVGESTETIDLEGRLVVPGFIETHAHFVGLGEMKSILELKDAASWDDIVASVAQAARTAAPGAWIRGRGWHQEKWRVVPKPNVDGAPLHHALSAVSPNNPVLLVHESGHAAFANARALQAAAIGRKTPDPPGGTIVRDASGEATGFLRETAQGLVSRAMAAAMAARPQGERETEFRQAVRLAGEEALAKGVTTLHDAASTFATIDHLRVMADAGMLPVRLYVRVGRESNDSLAAHLARYRTIGAGNGFLTVRSIKRMIDGALGSHGAWLLEPYADMPRSTGLVVDSVAQIEQTARLAMKHGYQLSVHAIGDRGNREVLDLFERTFAAAGARGQDLRWRIEHAQLLHPDDIARFAGLGVIAAMQGVHAVSDGPWVPTRIGADRARTRGYMWRALLDAKAVIANGSDAPVEDLDPIAGFHASVTRRMVNGSVFFAEQRMSRDEALRSYTLDAAYAGFEEDVKGSLTPGKLADVVVLSKDILAVPEGEIRDARVDLTILGGTVRYRRASAAKRP